VGTCVAFGAVVYCTRKSGTDMLRAPIKCAPPPLRGMPLQVATAAAAEAPSARRTIFGASIMGAVYGMGGEITSGLLAHDIVLAAGACMPQPLGSSTVRSNDHAVMPANLAYMPVPNVCRHIFVVFCSCFITVRMLTRDSLQERRSSPLGRCLRYSIGSSDLHVLREIRK
jgi:hypothetical protein